MEKDQGLGRLSEASGVDRLWYPAIRTKSDMPMFVQWLVVIVKGEPDMALPSLSRSCLPKSVSISNVRTALSGLVLRLPAGSQVISKRPLLGLTARYAEPL